MTTITRPITRSLTKALTRGISTITTAEAITLLSLYNGLDAYPPTEPVSTDSGSKWTQDYQGTLVQTPADTPAIVGGYWTGTDWSDTLADDTPLQPYVLDEAGNKNWIFYQPWQSGEAVTTGTIRAIPGTDALEYYAECTTAGTTGSSAPSVSSSDIGGTVADNGVVWAVQGYHCLQGQRIEDVCTQYILTPLATQTTPSLATDKYTLSVKEGGGSIAVSANTATITGAGTATYGNPVTFEVTGAGTVDLTFSGTVTKANLTNTDFETSYIVESTGTVTRPSDIITKPWPAGLTNGFVLDMVVNIIGPVGSDVNNNRVFSAITTSTNRFELFITDTNGIGLIKVAGSESTGTFSFLYSLVSPISGFVRINAYFSSEVGIGLRIQKLGEAWRAWRTDNTRITPLDPISSFSLLKYYSTDDYFLNGEVAHCAMHKLPSSLTSAAEVQAWCEDTNNLPELLR